MMPAFGRDGLLNKAEMADIAGYVRTLSGNAPDPAADLAKGKQLFADNCSPCHGEDGKGNLDVGAPNLTTQVWLYGPTTADILNRIQDRRGRHYASLAKSPRSDDDQGAYGLRSYPRRRPIGCEPERTGRSERYDWTT